MASGSPLQLPEAYNGETYNPVQPYDLVYAQTEIVKRLKQRLKERYQIKGDIRSFPSDYKEYQFLNDYCAVLVRYMGSKYGDQKAIDITHQFRTVAWDILILCHDLGGSLGERASAGQPGVMGIIEAVRRSLTGLKLHNYGKLRPVEDGYVAYEDSVWAYRFQFEHSTGAVEEVEEPNAPLFIRGVAQERAGQTEVAVAPANLNFNDQGQITLGQHNITQIAMADVMQTTTYNQGADYSLDEVNGIVSIIPTGRLVVGMAVRLGFSYADTIATS